MVFEIWVLQGTYNTQEEVLFNKEHLELNGETIKVEEFENIGEI